MLQFNIYIATPVYFVTKQKLTEKQQSNTGALWSYRNRQVFSEISYNLTETSQEDTSRNCDVEGLNFTEDTPSLGQSFNLNSLDILNNSKFKAWNCNYH